MGHPSITGTCGRVREDKEDAGMIKVGDRVRVIKNIDGRLGQEGIVFKILTPIIIVEFTEINPHTGEPTIVWFEDDELELVESNDPETPETVLMDGTDNIENWRQRTLTDNNDTLLSNCQI